MEDLTTRAQLVDGSEVGAQSITATVPRREIEDTLAGDDGPADLILDVASGDASGETRRIAVEWERDDLERLLRQADGESVLFTFDRRALAQAFEDADVESHGLREKALILTVAAATAAGAAGAAKAVPDMGEGVTSQGPAAYTAIESARTGGSGAEGMSAEFSAIEAARSADQASQATSGASGASAIEAARSAGQADQGIPAGYGDAVSDFRSAEAVPDALNAGYAGVDTVGGEVAAEYGMPQATAAQEAAAQGVAAGEYGVPQATAADLAAAQGVAAGEYGMPQAAGGPGAAAHSGIEAARATAGTPASGDTGASGGESFVSAPDPATTAALAGMAALAITGAAFMARSRRRLTPSS